MKLHYPRTTYLFVALSLLLYGTTAASAFAQQIQVSASSPSGIYRLDEPVLWNIKVLDRDSAPAGTYGYQIRANNLTVIKSGEIDLSTHDTSIQTVATEPAMLYLELTPRGADASSPPKKLVAGAAVAPEKLQPSVSRPVDFDSFWDQKIKLLKSVPENPQLMSFASDKPDVEYATVVMDSYN